MINIRRVFAGLVTTCCQCESLAKSRVRNQDVDVGRLDDADTLIGTESHSSPAPVINLLMSCLLSTQE